MIRRAEGFAHFTAGADWLAKGHSYSGTAPSFSPTAGRDGRGAMRMTQGTPNQHVHWVLPAACAPVYDHIAFNSPALSAIYWAYYPSGGYDHVHIVFQGDGSIALYVGDNAFGPGVGPDNLTTADLVAVSPPALWRANTWHQVQVGLLPTPSGFFTFKLDGIEVTALRMVAADLYCGGGQNVTSVIRTGVNGGVLLYADSVLIDDVIDNSAEQQFVGFQGDLAVYEDVNPIDGAANQWVRSSGAGTYASHVNQNPQDADATYLRSAAAGNRQSFSHAAVTGALGTILAVKETVCHRKEEASFGALRGYLRDSAGANHDGPLVAAAQSYKFDEHIWEKDPLDGANWTAARVNAIQLGLKDCADEA